MVTSAGLYMDFTYIMPIVSNLGRGLLSRNLDSYGGPLDKPRCDGMARRESTVLDHLGIIWDLLERVRP